MILTKKYVSKSSNEKTESFFQKLRCYLKKFYESTSIHGLRYLTENRTTSEKIFWTITLLLSMAGCLFMITEIYTKFLNSPVVVTFATHDTAIYEVPFPAVTICPEAKTSGVKFKYSDVFNKIMKENQTLTTTESQYLHYTTLLCEDNYKLASLLSGGSDTFEDDFFDVIDWLKPDEFIACISYLGSEINCDGYFTSIVTDIGICYTFNILDRGDIYKEHVVFYKNFHHVNYTSQNFDFDEGYNKTAGVFTYPRRALMSGADNSLTVFFKHNTYNSDYVCNQFLQGFRVLLHSPGDVPRLAKSYFRIPFNKVVTAAITPGVIKISSSIKSLSAEQRHCYLKSERPLQHFKTYSQSNCLLECFANYTLKKCGCVSYFMPRANTTKICGTRKVECLRDAQSELIISDLENKISESSYKSSCDCKPMCSNLNYAVETSSAHFYWKDYFAQQQNFSFDVQSNDTDYSVLSIYFKTEQFISIERNELYGTTDLISNFGGLLGLFTGFSLISLIEIMYFWTLRIYYNLRLYNQWWGSVD